MIEVKTTIRVRYAETDMMGIAYHGNYFAWFEMARIEMLDSIGLPYRRMEQDGYRLPVLEARANYRIPARFDDMLIVQARLNERPSVRLTITYEVFRGTALLCTGLTRHAFLNHANEPVKPPAEWMKKMREYF